MYWLQTTDRTTVGRSERLQTTGKCCEGGRWPPRSDQHVLSVLPMMMESMAKETLNGVSHHAHHLALNFAMKPLMIPQTPRNTNGLTGISHSMQHTMHSRSSPGSLSPNLPSIVKVEPRLPSPCLSSPTLNDTYAKSNGVSTASGHLANNSGHKRLRIDESNSWGIVPPSPGQLSMGSLSPPPLMNGHSLSNIGHNGLSPNSSSYDSFSPNGESATDGSYYLLFSQLSQAIKWSIALLHQVCNYQGNDLARLRLDHNHNTPSDSLRKVQLLTKLSSFDYNFLFIQYYGNIRFSHILMLLYDNMFSVIHILLVNWIVNSWKYHLAFWLVSHRFLNFYYYLGHLKITIFNANNLQFNA